jgi:DNA-binding GntR family transcriptional regulator
MTGSGMDGANEPQYEQIKALLLRQIEDGDLLPAERIATDLGLLAASRSPNTRQ